MQPLFRLATVFPLLAVPLLSYSAATPLPAKIEAEAPARFFDLSMGNKGDAACGTSDLDVQRTRDTSGNCHVAFTQSGEWTEYDVTTPFNAEYRLILRAATGASSRVVRVQVDGATRASLTVPNRGYHTFSDMVTTLNLSPGEHRVRVVYANGSVNLNYLDFQRLSPPWADSDGDGIEDLMDQCPNTPAGSTPDAYGCTPETRDSDADGLPDLTDACPHNPGTPTAAGCPPGGDEDGDRIVNEQDLCPVSVGLVELRGCKPSFNDFDTDGVDDTKDECPYTNARSSVDPQGCSNFDRNDDDMDGVLNGGDICPMDSAWSPADMGCPPHQMEDYDEDGIINALDLCPHDFGHKRQNGCLDSSIFPWDVDQDGVDNKHDHCPLTLNTSSWTYTGPNGCSDDPNMEDADQDGAANPQDLCPLSPPGHAVNAEGCTGLQMHQRLDDDNDGINNALDLCPNTYLDPYASHPMESVTLHGCRMGEFDDDHDGVPDQLDQCPWEPGHRLFAGCRQAPATWDDADMDGTPDMHDRCPFSEAQTMPTSSYDGCQGNDRSDFDNDGVINGLDQCPASPAGSLTDTQGCNDLDRLDFDQDGVMNGVDLCPRTAGLPSRNGCADNPFDADMDGIDNRLDVCPYSLPFDAVDSRGCGSSPHAMDKDGDGVADDRDECRNTPTHEAADFHTGCSTREQLARQPDSDNDGVSDRIDFCPDTSLGMQVDATGCELSWEEQHDEDGDRAPNDLDLCPNTPHGVAINHEGCEVFRGVRVTQNLHRPFPQDFVDVEILVEEVPVQWSPLEPRGQPLIFELHDIVMQLDMSVWTDGQRLNIHVPPHLQARPVRIPVRLRLPHMENQFSNWFEVIIGGSNSAAASASLVINDPQVLEMTGIDLHAAFSLLSTFGGTGDPAVELFRQLWDSQRSVSSMGLPFFCTGEINGFPIVCDQPGTEVGTWDEFSVSDEMRNYRLTAVVNRLDLHNNWQDCGEHRLVFALQNGGPQRKFINLEARLPNPMPGDIQGCRPAIDFWRDIANLSGSNQAQRLNEFFYGGTMFPERAIAPENFTTDRGQIRTTQFWGDEWLFKEHKLEEYCGPINSGESSGGEPCRHWVRTVSVKENPFGELFNPQVAMFGGMFSAIAQDFQQWFPQNLASLLTNNPAEMHNRVEDRFNHGQSHASGPHQFENDYLAHFNGEHWSPFGMDIQMAIQGHHNADGSPITVENILARATAMTCAGCHAPDSFLSNFRGQIGTLELPDGTWINEWPLSHDFVHINEQGELSPGMLEVFLPARSALFEGMVGDLEMMF
jgi:hypothetical protein